MRGALFFFSGECTLHWEMLIVDINKSIRVWIGHNSSQLIIQLYDYGGHCVYLDTGSWAGTAHRL